MKGLNYQWVPIDRWFWGSELCDELGQRFGSDGIAVWLRLNLEWREPEAYATTDVELGLPGADPQKPERGLYRQVRFNHIWRPLPRGLGSKTLAKIWLWLHEPKKHLILTPDSVQVLSQLCSSSAPALHRASTYAEHKVACFWPKLLKFREECFRKITPRERYREKDVEDDREGDRISRPEMTYDEEKKSWSLRGNAAKKGERRGS